MTKVHVDASGPIDFFDGLIDDPARRARKELNAVLQSVFKETQFVVHVQTSSLKWSGKSYSTYNRGTHVWRGRIQYGGESPGINNPVTYAIYELDRHGEHNFMVPTEASEAQFIKAMRIF